jgi:hypothetical protein
VDLWLTLAAASASDIFFCAKMPSKAAAPRNLRRKRGDPPAEPNPVRTKRRKPIGKFDEDEDVGMNLHRKINIY